MNPVPTPLRENYTLSIQPGWNGVNVLNFPEGQRPNPVPHSPKVSSTKPPEATTWYGVYLLFLSSGLSSFWSWGNS